MLTNIWQGNCRGVPWWLQTQRLVCCRVCGLSVGARVAGGVHPRCWGRFGHDNVHSVPGGPPRSSEELPTLNDIFCVPVRTKEHVPTALLPLAQEEYGKLVGAVLQKNRADAWDHLPPAEGGRGAPDIEAMQAARRAWIEFFLFPKCLLCQFYRGQRPQQAYYFTQSLLLRGRWESGWGSGKRRNRVSNTSIPGRLY